MVINDSDCQRVLGPICVTQQLSFNFFINGLGSHGPLAPTASVLLGLRGIGERRELPQWGPG